MFVKYWSRMFTRFDENWTLVIVCGGQLREWVRCPHLSDYQRVIEHWRQQGRISIRSFVCSRCAPVPCFTDELFATFSFIPPFPRADLWSNLMLSYPHNHQWDERANITLTLRVNMRIVPLVSKSFESIQLRQCWNYWRRIMINTFHHAFQCDFHYYECKWHAFFYFSKLLQIIHLFSTKVFPSSLHSRFHWIWSFLKKYNIKKNYTLYIAYDSSYRIQGISNECTV